VKTKTTIMLAEELLIAAKRRAARSDVERRGRSRWAGRWYDLARERARWPL